MAHIRVIKIVPVDMKCDHLELLVGTFSSDQEAIASITQSGTYFFLEAHEVTVESKKPETKTE